MNPNTNARLIATQNEIADRTAAGVAEYRSLTAALTPWPGMDEELNPFGVTEQEWCETNEYVAARGTEEERAARAARFVHQNLCGAPAACEHPEYHDIRPASLDALFRAMKAGDPSTLSDGGTYRGDLPIFGPQHRDEGGTMDPAPGVWSWDWSRAIHGTCPADLCVSGYKVDEDGVMTLVGYPTRGRHARTSKPISDCPKCKSSCCSCEIAWNS